MRFIADVKSQCRFEKGKFEGLMLAAATKAASLPVEYSTRKQMVDHIQDALALKPVKKADLEGEIKRALHGEDDRTDPVPKGLSPRTPGR